MNNISAEAMELQKELLSATKEMRTLKLYTIAMLMEIIPLSYDTLRDWVMSGEFGKTVNVSKFHFVTQKGLDGWIEQHLGEPMPLKKNFSSRKRKKIEPYVYEKIPMESN